MVLVEDAEAAGAEGEGPGRCRGGLVKTLGKGLFAFFRDGPSAQDAIILGSIASTTDGTIDIPVEAQLNPPTNKVHKTEAGHIIEVDNTSGSERINIKHKTGSRLTMNADGTIDVVATNIRLNA